MRLKSFRGVIASAAAFILVTTMVAACGELTGPTSPSTPTNVVATLASATSVSLTWTPSPLNDGVVSYSIYRNGAKVAESTTNSYTDTGLAQQTTYIYTVAANCKSGVVSDRSTETPASTVTTVDITAPRVLSTIPVNGATGVSRAGTSTVTFSEPMDPTTINTSTFNIRITSSGQILPGTVVYTTATRVAEFIPTSPLPNLTNLTVTVTTGAKDLAGNALAAPFTVAWTTRDEDGPTVTASTPTNGATGVSPTASITVTFSEAVDATTVNATNITLRTAAGAAVAGIVTYNATTHVATFTQGAPLTQGITYTLTVNNVKDAAGNLMPAPFQITFTVNETIPPTVMTVSPANNATNVPTNTAVQVTFNEPMDATTIAGTTNIELRNTVTSAVIPGTVTYNAATNVGTFTPSGPLSNSTNYTVIVTTGVKDAAGNALASPFSSNFTTAAVADTTPPTIVSRTPTPGATGVATNTTVTVTFNEPMLASTINATNITLAPTAGGPPVAATVTPTTSTTATLTPTSPLANNTSYTLTVTTGVKDVAGNLLAANSTSTFTTIADTTAPTVVSTVPTSGATSVPVTSTVTVKFSEDMQQSTFVYGTTFSVRTTVGSVLVPGIVSVNHTTFEAVFTPTAALSPGTSYTVTVTTGVKDLAGNGLTGNFSYSFTTAP